MENPTITHKDIGRDKTLTIIEWEDKDVERTTITRFLSFYNNKRMVDSHYYNQDGRDWMIAQSTSLSYKD